MAKTVAERMREYRARHRDRVNARDRELRKLQKRIYDPEQKYAWNVVSAAIRRGKLVREPCEICGADQVEAHHDDYSRPLDVRWLCPSHHEEHHSRLRAAIAPE